jgi:hypothetical protein
MRAVTRDAYEIKNNEGKDKVAMLEEIIKR